jgi:mono/diheme cytochrome c family protein
MKWTFILTAIATAFLELSSAAVAQSSAEIERGRALVERNCATCHAVGRSGSSPYAPAPPFRTLHERYDVEALAEAFAEGIIVGHDGARQMPNFRLEPPQIDDLIAYLKSLEIAPSRRAPEPQ